MGEIIYISGGQRSGKSRFAQELAESLSPRPVYLATSRILDDEMDARVSRHQADRGEQWITIEEERYISRLPDFYQWQETVILLDCITLWATNWFFDLRENSDQALSGMKNEWDAFVQLPHTIIAVSNEIGMGVIPADALSRKFTDLQGFINQYIAGQADRQYLMVSGTPLILKPMK